MSRCVVSRVMPDGEVSPLGVMRLSHESAQTEARKSAARMRCPYVIQAVEKAYVLELIDPDGVLWSGPMAVQKMREHALACAGPEPEPVAQAGLPGVQENVRRGSPAILLEVRTLADALAAMDLPPLKAGEVDDEGWTVF